MSTSSAPPVERFKGTSWEECNEFILAIRARAFWEGKQRDPAWMADFAANYFWQKAMSWHCRLPQDVRQDWLQLEMALVDRWPPLEDDDDARIKPTPAAAPSLDRSSKADLPRQGILKLVLDESKTIYYLKLGFTHCFLTTNQDEAIRVRCNPVFGTILLEKIDHSQPYWLAAHWRERNPKIGNGSTDHAVISCVELNSLKSTYPYSGPLQLLKCTILANGEVIPVWTKDDSTKITLFPFLYDTSNLCLTADPEACGRKHGREKRAKFFLEPID